jgi:apolipoprotein N-acyltransferase
LGICFLKITLNYFKKQKMKRFIAILVVVLFSTTMIYAQVATPKQPTKKATTETKAVKADAKKAAKPAAAVTTTPKATTKTGAVKADTKKAVAPATAAPMKKDGTPDKRFKENKAAAAAPAAGPTKKDGTPDMSYKANKKAAEKTK